MLLRQNGDNKFIAWFGKALKQHNLKLTYKNIKVVIMLATLISNIVVANGTTMLTLFKSLVLSRLLNGSQLCSHHLVK